ncbi:uncharacterized protein LOC132699488 [Cylas formicarius]|uniref:uncharacterized protein LOC132699488 n=1 Tax=Cylas formicarius TaxID=197179 RepID=UPI002958CBE1|nr:uncharacterized protein LOC132699488 [Cylas formicarius]
MHRPTIAFANLIELRCRHCENFLSCGPLYLLEDSSTLCGRCRMLARDHYRNDSLEALKSIFRYPCINWRNHCPVTLQWNESLIHERECHYYGGCGFLCSHPGAFFKGKRDFPKEDLRLTTVPEHIFGYIKCVVCEGFLSCEPVYTQINGKNICHRCINSNGVPPNCRRNLPYETFSKTLVFPCSFRSKGCPERGEFGRGLWQHEAECPYGAIIYQQSDQKRESQAKKEKGVIKTHTGHIWATITPNSQLFAPPEDPNNDINKQLLKSLAKKQQERHIKRADQIGDELRNRRMSGDSAVSTAGSLSTKNSASHGSEISIGEIFDKVLPSYTPPEEYNNISLHSSRSSSVRRNERRFVESGGVQHDLSFPAYLIPRSNLERTDSMNSSFRGNRELISELKVRQNIIKKTHSIKGRIDLDQNNPYRQCNNLDDMVTVHNQIK